MPVPFVPYGQAETVDTESARTINDQSLEIFWQILRSGRPGPWASDHFEQVKHFVGIPYVVVHAIATWVASSTVRAVRRVEGESIEGGNRRGISNGRTPLERAMIRKALTAAGAQESDEKWEPLEPDHPAWIPIRQPNPQQTIADVLYEHTIQKLLTGTAMTWNIPNGYGEPAEWYVLPQALTNALPPSGGYPNGAYRVLPLFSSGPFATIPGYAAMGGTIIASEYMAIDRYAHPYVKYDGYSPLEAAAAQLDILQEIDNCRWYSFAQGIDPSLYVELPQGTTKAQWLELQAKLEENHAGTRNRKKPMALLGGAKAIFPQRSPTDMGFETGWDQLVKFVCAVFRCPAVVAGLAQSSTYAEWYAALKQFFTGTLIPHCSSTAAHWTLRIVRPAFGDDIRYQIDPPAIDDQEQLLGRLGFLKDCGALTKGEARVASGFELFGDERDDEIAGDEKPLDANGLGLPASGPDAKRPKNSDGKGSLPERIAKALNVNGDSVNRIAAILKAGHDVSGQPRDDIGRWTVVAGHMVGQHPPAGPMPPILPGMYDPTKQTAEMVAARERHTEWTGTNVRHQIAERVEYLLTRPMRLTSVKEDAPEKAKARRAAAALEEAEDAATSLELLTNAGWASHRSAIAGSHTEGGTAMDSARDEAARRLAAALDNARRHLVGLSADDRTKGERRLARLGDSK